MDGWRHSLCRAIALSLLVALPSLGAAENSYEHEQLTALTRQLDLLDRLAEHIAKLPLQERARYHFDYARLRDDLQRVRTGIDDYLTPQRAQPRDPTVLVGDYRRESAAGEKP